MSIFNADKIFNQIVDCIENTTRTKVSEHVKCVQQDVIWDKWYNTYEPKSYSRRYNNKGLIDEDNMVTRVLRKGNNINFTLDNITKTNPYTKKGNNYEPIYSSLEGDDFLIPLMKDTKLRPKNNNVDIMKETENEISMSQIMDIIKNDLDKIKFD